MTIGDRIRAARKAAGWSVTEAARRAGTSCQYLCDIEHDRRVPKLDLLRRIAKAVNRDLADLL